MKNIQNRRQTNQISNRKVGAVFLCAVLGFISSASVGLAQQNPEVAEWRAAWKASQQQLSKSEAERKELIKSLAESVRVSEEQTFAAQEVQAKLAAFGVDLLESSKDSLEQRLLKAVRDLNIMRQENERLRKANHELSEAFLNYLAATPDAKENQRGQAQEAIAKAGKSLNELVAANNESARRIEKSQVVSINQDWLVVIDAGRKSGVLVGTPIVIERDEQPLYTAMIVDVRDTISGAVLQDRVGNAGAVQIGDRIRPLATETDL